MLTFPLKPAAAMLAIAATLSTRCSAQTAVNLAPVPPSAFELASTGVHVADTPEERAQLVDLMDRAREYYALMNAHVPFHLKTSFAVSGNVDTRFDGAWQLEETFVPKLGIRLTAETSGYSLQHLRAGKLLYQSPEGVIPLRLHEALGHLIAPVEPGPKTERDLIRSVQSSLNGVPVTCVLLSNAQRSNEAQSPGRFWQEREECIDPQSGHLLLHSPVPGLAILYDFSDSLHFHDKELPRKMTVMENGSTVIEERIDTLEDVAPAGSAGSNLFTPAPPMQPRGTIMGGRITMTYGFLRPTVTPIQTVVVFGLLNPDGSITEAHPLQSSDSRFVQTAVDRVSRMHYQVPVAPGASPEQHEFFAVVRFSPEN